MEFINFRKKAYLNFHLCSQVNLNLIGFWWSKIQWKSFCIQWINGMLERGEIDVAGAGLFVTFDRTQVG